MLTDLRPDALRCAAARVVPPAPLPLETSPYSPYDTVRHTKRTDGDKTQRRKHLL